jgi:FdhE protein
MAAVCEAQQRALAALGGAAMPAPLAQQVARAGVHGMPLLPAVGWAREEVWREILRDLCSAIDAAPGFPQAVATTAGRLAGLPESELESQADRILSGSAQGVDVQGAPFVMAALQVYWAHRVGSLALDQLATLTPSAAVVLVCPLCGSLPVASVVRADKEYQGYRYLCCALCATEWHLVRVTCSHCQSTAGIHYQSIEGGSSAIRAEACDPCHTYRKILYQEHEPNVEPVADDLASLTLDLLMSEAGFKRASGHPLLWHST